MAAALSIAGESRRAVAEALQKLGRDFAEIRPSGPRAATAGMTALSVAISITIACAMHLPDVWWAGISGFISSQATRPDSLRKGMLRIVGTAAGAALAFLLAGWLAYDHAACCLALLIGASIATLGLSVSPHGYAWMLFGITFAMVVLMSLADPALAFHAAATRTIEVVVGTLTAMLVALVLAPADAGKPEPPAAGWTDLFDARWPAVLHAVRAGIAVASIPLVWSWFDLPDITTMATTMASVMAIPVLADHPLDDGRRIIGRAVQRLLGCCLGGALGLLLLGLQLTGFLPWLLLLSLGVWAFAHMQASPRGMGYVSMQAGMVLVMTLVQGEGPPEGIMPGINRLTGIACGLVVLCLVSVLLQPQERDAAPA